jgi:DNA-binding transcriptional LysR family regulator
VITIVVFTRRTLRPAEAREKAAPRRHTVTAAATIGPVQSGAMDRLDAMRTFVEVVRHGGFAAAGRRLGVSRAVVAKRIQQLEEQLGARFFHRTTRKLSTTDAGARFHAHCTKILALFDEATADVDERSARLRGLLRMTVPSAFAEMHLVKHLAAFAGKHEGLALDVDASERFVDLVRGGFDLAVRIATSPPADAVAKKLAPSSVLLCASRAYLARRGEPRDPGEIAQHDCIGYTNQANAGEWDFGSGPSRRTVRFSPKHRTNDNRVLRGLARDGRGLVQLPAYFVEEDLAAGRLVSVLHEHRDRSRSVWIVYPSRTRVASKVRAMVDHLSAVFRGHRRWE